MKAFKALNAARKFANGGPIIRVGKLYLAAPESTPGDLALTSVDLIAPKGNVTGTVTLWHLERLGNANWAEPRKSGVGGYGGYGGADKVFKDPFAA